nr:MAG TPA: hypothetical protein [Caudoviricetes sp.]
MWYNGKKNTGLNRAMLYELPGQNANWFFRIGDD